MDEALSNNNEVNQNIPWYFKYQILLCIGIMMGGEILRGWFSDNVSSLVFLLGNANLLFFIPRDNNLIHSKLGNNLKGVILFNLIFIVGYFGFLGLYDLFTSILNTYLPPQLYFGLKILFGMTMLVFIISKFYQAVKSTKNKKSV